MDLYITDVQYHVKMCMLKLLKHNQYYVLSSV